MHHNFLSAIIPVHRLHIHVRRLVSKGYKVGVVKQEELAALKDNKNVLFSRKLHTLYTKSTLIGGEFSDSTSLSSGDEIEVGSGFLACIYEEQSSCIRKGLSNVAVVAIQPTSGDMFYSLFQDTFHRTELERVLLCIDPSEILHPISGLNTETECLLNNTLKQRSSHLRLEKLDNNVFNYAFAINKVSSFYDSKTTTEESKSTVEESVDVMQKVLSLPPPVLCCLSGLIVYLSNFKLERILKNLDNMKPLTELSEHVTLNAAALRNLEIFGNATNYSEHGSLLWVLNKTLTRFGERLLKLWISRPLKSVDQIEERLDVVTEIVHSDSLIFNLLEKVFAKSPDLEKMLCSVFYHKCSCSEFVCLIHALTSLKNEFLNISDKVSAEIKTPRLKNYFSEITNLLNDVESFGQNVNEKAAREEDKTNLFIDTTFYTPVENSKIKIKSVEKKLNDLKAEICKTLHQLVFKYTTVSGQKYLIEVRNSHLHLVPSNWMKISGTKQLSRFRSPEVSVLHIELEQQQAILIENCNEAWHTFLDDFGDSFYKYKRVISCLAELDCFLSFAKLAKDESYCRPLVLDDDSRVLDVQQGRNPILMKLMGEESQFVANDTKLNTNKRCMIVTGPNMGGKSTYIRQVALIAILAHVGSYIPADSATLPLFDGIYVRMGAEDDMVRSRSTFMIEMCETADILASATSKSLVILDELGRGTSTHDGSSIAYATLESLIDEVKCLTLFTTHYPQVVNLQSRFPDNIITAQMAFIIENSNNIKDIECVTFLYNMVHGISEKSYGINVAHLVGIPQNLLLRAQKKSQEFESQIVRKRKMRKMLKNLLSLPKSYVVEKLQELNICIE